MMFILRTAVYTVIGLVLLFGLKAAWDKWEQRKLSIQDEVVWVKDLTGKGVAKVEAAIKNLNKGDTVNGESRPEVAVPVAGPPPAPCVAETAKKSEVPAARVPVAPVCIRTDSGQAPAALPVMRPQRDEQVLHSSISKLMRAQNTLMKTEDQKR